MRVALCHPFILPDKGGCETYILDLARRLAEDDVGVSLLAWECDPTRLPRGVRWQRIDRPRFCRRFLRPWLFGSACLDSLRLESHDVSVGFDKTWGQDVLYPQGGLHAATAAHNLIMQPPGYRRWWAKLRQGFDLGHWSFRRVERTQYFGGHWPTVLVNSEMVRRHFTQFYGSEPDDVRVVPSAIDPRRLDVQHPERCRVQTRAAWGVAPESTAALFAATNYELKGLAPLLRALAHAPSDLVLVVVGNADAERYRRLAERLGVGSRVRWLGHCSSMGASYRSADFLVHPTFYDPCSLVALEANACGLPVLTSRYNGACEVLWGNASDVRIIRDPHDSREVGDHLEHMCDPVRRGRQLDAVRAKAWPFEDHYREIRAVLDEVASRKSKPMTWVRHADRRPRAPHQVARARG